MGKKIVKRDNNKKKGFTLVELLGVIVILSVIVVVAAVAVTKFVDSSKKTSRELVVKSVKTSANTYASELGEEYWVSSAGDTNEYICMNVQQLIDAGYFKSDDFEDSSDDSDEIVKSTNILVTRKKSNQVITAVDFKDDGYCSGTLGYDLPGGETTTDTTKPACSWTNISNVEIGSTKTATLTCTDAGSRVATSSLSASNFTVSGVSITSVSSGTAVTNGYKFNVTYKGTTVGTGKYIELKANVVSDNSGNKNAVLRSGTFSVTDTTKPVCTWSNVGNVAEGATKTATLTCTDAGSGIATTTLSASNFTVSGVSITSVSSGTAVTNGYKFNVTYKGTTVGTGKYVELKANVVSDNSSNKNAVLRSSTFSVTGNVDNTKPTITYEDLKKNSSGESAVYNLGTYWTRNDRKYKITFNDNEGLASYKITYQKRSATYDFESGQINNSNKTFSKEFTFDEYVYYITVTDKAGNVSDTKTIYASDYIDNDVPDYSKNDVDWVCNSNNRYVSFNIDLYDTKSGISSYKYKVASSYRVVDSGWQSWTSGNLLDCGDNYLQIKVVDKVGNVRIVNIDDYYCSCSDYYDDDDYDDDDYDYDDPPYIPPSNTCTRISANSYSPSGSYYCPNGGSLSGSSCIGSNREGRQDCSATFQCSCYNGNCWWTYNVSTLSCSFTNVDSNGHCTGNYSDYGTTNNNPSQKAYGPNGEVCNASTAGTSKNFSYYYRNTCVFNTYSASQISSGSCRSGEYSSGGMCYYCDSGYTLNRNTLKCEANC